MVRRLSPTPSKSLFCTLLFLTVTSALPTIKSRESTVRPTNWTQSTIKWSACSDGLGDDVQCGTISVLVDWDEPDGEHFDLGMVKLPAIASETIPKVGSLFINPGGPGGSASQLVAGIGAAANLDETFRASFDIIGLDPRGVALSHKVECDMSIYAERVSLFPQTEDEFDKLVDKNKRLGNSCRKLTGPLFEHVDTIRYV
jgi:hypothetical protein